MILTLKRFLQWIGMKEKLHNRHIVPPFASERELWWVSFGENIGFEINGKSKLFTRPGLILKKLSRTSYLVAPTTSQNRAGSWFAQIKHEGRLTYACLHQIRVVDYRRFFSRLGQIDSDNFDKIKEAFWALYK